MLTAALVLAVGTTLVSAGTAHAATAGQERPPFPTALSPAGCSIEYVTDPHPAESVPGAIKVNAKAQCRAAVPEQDLSVTLLADGKPLVKTVTKATDKAFLFNQSTYITCKNFTDKHTFQGAAMGTSFENSQPYIQFMSGRSVELACGY